MDKVFEVIDLLINRGVSFAMSVRIFALFFPTVLSLSVPMSILLAALLVFGRLSEDHEITALRASGLSFNQIMWPPMLGAFLLCLILIPFNTVWAPLSVAAFRTIYHEIANKDPLVKIEPGQFIPLRNIRLYAEKVDRDNNALTNVWIYRREDDRAQRIFAKSGVARADARQLTLNLKDGQIERFSGDQPQDVVHIRFKHYNLQVPLSETTDAHNTTWRELTTPQLNAEIRRRIKENIPAGEVLAEYHLRYAIAFAPLALGLLGISLGMTLERGGRGVGFGAAAGVLFVYYLLLIMGLSLAQKDAFPALPSLWAANAVCFAAGAYLYRRRTAT